MDELLINSTTRPKPLKKPSQHAQASTSSPGTMYSTTRLKPLKKPCGGANLQSSQKIWISDVCETKLGCVLSFLENAITYFLFAARHLYMYFLKCSGCSQDNLCHRASSQKKAPLTFSRIPFDTEPYKILSLSLKVNLAYMFHNRIMISLVTYDDKFT